MTHPLSAAFLATRYRICLDGIWYETRIGQVAPGVRDWLRQHGGVQASLISARNPQGLAASESDNADREARLRAWLHAAGRVAWPAEGVAEDLAWREPSLWVPGLGGERCRTVMQDFDQLAWVEYDASGLARLCWTDSRGSQD